MKINNKKFAVALSKISAIVYVVCSIFVALFPKVSETLMDSLTHIQSNLVRQVTLVSFFSGLIQVVIYSYIAGMIFAWIFNKSVEK